MQEYMIRPPPQYPESTGLSNEGIIGSLEFSEFSHNTIQIPLQFYLSYIEMVGIVCKYQIKFNLHQIGTELKFYDRNKF